MPTYEYQCKSCQHLFEVFQGIKDEPIKKCPECGREVKRLIGGGLGVIFKGSGFYTTDYKKSSAVSGSVKSSGGDAKKTEKSEAKTEPKKDNGGDAKKKEPVKA